VPGIIGTLQATETLKLILGIGKPLVGRFVVYDALKMRFRELKLPRDPDCPVCGERPAITTLQQSGELCLAPAPGAMVAEVSAAELKARLGSARPPVLVDVREASEAAICRLSGARLIPLGELPARVDELDPHAEIVVHCKSGARSARAVLLLQERGFSRVSHLAGGILSWINDIDPTLPRY
jgi:rhodanese-related sulfurtransferase